MTTSLLIKTLLQKKKISRDLIFFSLCMLCFTPAYADEYGNEIAVAPMPTCDTTIYLKGVRLVSDPDSIDPSGCSCNSIVEADDLPIFQSENFKQLIEQYVGKPLQKKSLFLLTSDIRRYLSNHSVIVSDVIYPEQDVTNGYVQILVLEGKIGQINIENNRWFSDNLIRNQIRLTEHSPLNEREITANLDWLNRNPFRRVDLIYEPGKKRKETDLTFRVNDKFPLRVFTGYDNIGNRFTGFNRIFAGFNWGNAFGLDHIMNYQYTTNINTRKLQAHNGDYTFPLRWHHLVNIFGAYEQSKPDSVAPFHMKGQYWQTSGRYIIPFSPRGRFRHEMNVGYDFKSVTNNAFFDVLSFFNSKYQISQFNVHYDLFNEDRHGTTVFSVTAVGSPGHMTSHNNTKTFRKFRDGAVSSYVYGKGVFERKTQMGGSWSYVARLAGQGTWQRLMVSEQMGMGGIDTVRGFEERDANGDQGWFTNQEIHTPPVSMYKKNSYGHRRDYLYFLAFYDVGQVFNRRPPPGENHFSTLSSAGIGVRYSFQKNIFIRADWGIPISNSSVNHHTKLPQRVNMVGTFAY